MLDYNVAAENGSMYNTPPCWPIYVCGLVFKHLLKLGGLAGELLDMLHCYVALRYADVLRVHAAVCSLVLQHLLTRDSMVSMNTSVVAGVDGWQPS
jgi:hypothetical protein